jgi:hypothetical protein
MGRNFISRALVTLGYVAAGIGAIAMVLGVAVLAGAVALAVAVRGLASPPLALVARRMREPASAGEPVQVDSVPRMA